MRKSTITGGTAHPLPVDMRKVLMVDGRARETWEGLTSLARNEWICWVISVKKAETRVDHVRRMIVELTEGKRRPCCWIGCIRRTDKAVSPSVRGILARRNK